MTGNVAAISTSESQSSVLDFLSPEEAEQLEVMRKDAASAGFALFDADGYMLLSEGIDEMAAPIFAHIFELAERLGPTFGQISSRSLVFESNDMEINCRRWSQMFIVAFRTKTGHRLGA